MNYQNVYSSVNSLTKSEAHPAGLCWIKFTSHEDVEIWPEIDPMTGICKEAIELKVGRSWKTIHLPDADRMFSEAQEDTVAGPIYKMNVSGYLAGNQASNVLTVAAMSYHQFVVLCKDRDGLTRMLGDEDSGAEFKNSYNSGEKTTSRKRIISFGWESPNPAPIYADSSIPPVDPPTSHQVGYATTDTVVTSGNVDTIEIVDSVTVSDKATSFSVMISVSNRYQVFREPAIEPLKTRYENGLNNEPMDDYTFDAPVVIEEFRYYFTRGPRSFDGSYPTILKI